jgi:hypothetical protein
VYGRDIASSPLAQKSITERKGGVKGRRMLKVVWAHIGNKGGNP